MNKYKKPLLLTFLLGAPVFVILFLYGFNKNQYDIEVFYPNGYLDQTPGIPHKVKSFELTDQDSAVFGFPQKDSALYVVNFFFTRCGSFCPVVTNKLSRVQDKFGDNDKVKILSLSVDPEFDTPKILKDYETAFAISGNNWKLLTGNKEEIYNIINEGFLLPVQDSAAGEHDFIHSDRIVLIDSQQRIRGYYEGQNNEEIDRLLAEVSILLSQF